MHKALLLIWEDFGYQLVMGHDKLLYISLHVPHWKCSFPRGLLIYCGSRCITAILGHISSLLLRRSSGICIPAWVYIFLLWVKIQPRVQVEKIKQSLAHGLHDNQGMKYGFGSLQIAQDRTTVNLSPPRVAFVTREVKGDARRAHKTITGELHHPGRSDFRSRAP